ncbi:MAG: cytochrome c-type biogenesis protein CcmH [Rhodospirillaceae bacterium]|nr:cytochrome c-type biogenesis protein CcmH [Rhodospirillaceae bacterium]
MKRILSILAALPIFAALLISISAFAVEPDERLNDPAAEARAREVSKALRCVVCQNETIDDSNAELARDMRLLVRERIKAGDTNDQVLAYMVQRYGDFVLLKPRMTGETLVLWFGPFLVLIVGGFIVMRRLRKPAPAAAPEALSMEDAKALQEITNTDDGTQKDSAP